MVFFFLLKSHFVFTSYTWICKFQHTIKLCSCVTLPGVVIEYPNITLNYTVLILNYWTVFLWVLFLHFLHIVSLPKLKMWNTLMIYKFLSVFIDWFVFKNSRMKLFIWHFQKQKQLCLNPFLVWLDCNLKLSLLMYRLILLL